jgi:hypothetical protein
LSVFGEDVGLSIFFVAQPANSKFNDIMNNKSALTVAFFINTPLLKMLNDRNIKPHTFDYSGQNYLD